MKRKLIGAPNESIRGLLGKLNRDNWSHYLAGTCLVTKVNLTEKCVEVYILVSQQWSDEIEKCSFEVLNGFEDMPV